MLHVTQDATNHILQLRKERKLGDQAPRFVASGNGLGLTFASKPKRGDTVVELEELPIYLAPDVANALDGSVIDAREEDGKRILVLKRNKRSN